jgi:REP element-mobilizing transposase RayT
MRYPRGYHITFRTYGTLLPGSSKPFVDRGHNEYGSNLPKASPSREQAARDRMTADPVYLTLEQRRIVEEAIDELTGRYRWPLHAKAAQQNHVHVVLTAPRAGEPLRDAVKACCSRALNERFGLRIWWAEKGSARYLWEDDYFERAVNYVNGQRDF